MKQLLRAGLCMLAVLAALVIFRLNVSSAPKARPVSVAAPTAVPTAAPVSVTLPPPTTVPLPPTPSPTPPPFTTSEEAEAYLLGLLDEEGYIPITDTLPACFDSVPESYIKLDGIYSRPNPGTGQGEMIIQYWYCLDPARILTFQQVWDEPLPQGSNELAYTCWRLSPYFRTTGWVNYSVRYSTNLDSSYISARLDSINAITRAEAEFMTHIS